jgi:Flp pilus assembly protein TadD
MPALAGAGPSLSGLYKGDLGIIEFTTEGGHASGRLQIAGACDFTGQPQLVDGEFEGNVLVGKVMLCQTGAGCGQKTYPFLGFYNPVDGSLSGDVRLDAGCASAALKGTRLLMTLATSEDRARAKGTASASAVAQKKLNFKKNPEIAKQYLLSAKAALTREDWAAAATAFQNGINYDEANWAAYMGLGVAEFNRGNTLEAIKSYQRSSALARSSGKDFADIYYNMACAYSRLGDKRQAISNLRTAVNMGFGPAEVIQGDTDLNGLLRDDPEFVKLVKDAGNAKNNASARRGSQL